MGASTVMLVEDDPAIHEALGQLLIAEGYSVLVASNGKEGLEVLARSATRPSVILLDLMMPVLSGWEFLERWSAIAPWPAFRW